MPLRSIVLVGLRYFALVGIISATTSLLCQLGIISAMIATRVPLGFEAKSVMLYASMVNVAVSGVLWFLAPRLSRLLCRSDAESATVNVGGLNRPDLYAFAIVLAGLSAVMTSLHGMTSWLWYVFIILPSVGGSRANDPQQSFYTLASHIVPLLCGLVLLWQSSRLAGLLSNRDAAAEVK